MFTDHSITPANGWRLRGDAAALAQRGISLIELIMFIVIIGVALAGILLVMNKVTAHSADTLIRKQALAVAESLLEEIELQAMSGVAPNIAPPNAVRTSFDNVFNYNGYFTTTATGGVTDMAGGSVGLANYNIASVTVTNVALGDITVASASAVMITVTVTDPTGDQLELTGYRAGN